MKVTSLEERFWAKVHKTDGCWLWTGSQTGNGYGQFKVDGRIVLAHRLAYSLLVSAIPEGLQIDHLCRTRNCVNANHLEVVTHRENIMRGFSPTALNTVKTHCPYGHPYDAENTRVCNGKRKCRTCNRLFNRARRGNPTEGTKPRRNER